MTTQDRPIALARWLGSVLAEGNVLSQSVEDYMSGTFGCSDLAHILETADSGEIDSLLELLFYPDLEMKDRFESRWGHERFDPQALETVIELASATPISATITTPSDGNTIHIELPEFVIEAFIRRLNIAWQPTPDLQTCLDENSRHPYFTRMCVHLRHARVPWHAGQVGLIGRFITKMPETAENLETDLTFLLDILDEFAPNCDPFDFLAAKKFFYFQSLCKAEDYERKRQASNMEIMMLQGNRAAHGSISQWRLKMQHIDRICQVVFGRTQFFQQPNAQSIDSASIQIFPLP
ncbi:MAG: hypothetical protein PVG41_13760 [Desulfobacteraceae bacterium]|jgi:hypothetical protein